MLTIHEVIMNAHMNLRNGIRSNPIFLGVAEEQLGNALAQIEEGKGLYDEYQEKEGEPG